MGHAKRVEHRPARADDRAKRGRGHAGSVALKDRGLRACRDVPQPHRFIAAGAREQLAVRG